MRLFPKGEEVKKTPTTICNVVGVFLMNENNEEINMEFALSLVVKNGSEVKVCKMSKSFEAHYRWGYAEFISLKELEDNPDYYLPHGILNIRCNFTIFHSEVVEKGPARKRKREVETCESMKKFMSNLALSDSLR